MKHTLDIPSRLSRVGTGVGLPPNLLRSQATPSCGVMQPEFLPETGGVRPGAMPVSGAAVFFGRA